MLKRRPRVRHKSSYRIIVREGVDYWLVLLIISRENWMIIDKKRTQDEAMALARKIKDEISQNEVELIVKADP